MHRLARDFHGSIILLPLPGRDVTVRVLPRRLFQLHVANSAPAVQSVQGFRFSSRMNFFTNSARP